MNEVEAAQPGSAAAWDGAGERTASAGDHRRAGGQAARSGGARVRDDGCGVDPGDHRRAFDLFRRSGAEVRPGENVRQLVRRLGRRIEPQSALGQGAIFRLTFPKRLDEAAKEAGRGASS